MVAKVRGRVHSDLTQHILVRNFRSQQIIALNCSTSACCFAKSPFSQAISELLWTVTVSDALCQPLPELRLGFQLTLVNSVYSTCFYHFIKLHRDNHVWIIYYPFTPVKG